MDKTRDVRRAKASRFSSANKQTVKLFKGDHTIGQARCTNFRAQIYRETNNLDSSLAQTRALNCPRRTGSGDNNLAPLDVQSPTAFDNSYYNNLVSKRGLLHSDQRLFNGGSTDSIVRTYNNSKIHWAGDKVGGDAY